MECHRNNFGQFVMSTQQNNLMLKLCTLLLVLLVPMKMSSTTEIEKICWNDKQQSGCGSCIKSHIGCVWCTDPEFMGSHRCDTFENLLDACPRNHIYRPEHKIDTKTDSTSGKDSDVLQPRLVHIEMRPGETVSFPVKYIHRNGKNQGIYLRHSETASKGVHLAFSNDCAGRPTEGRSCSNPRVNDLVTFTVNVTLHECANGQGDIAVSMGIGGNRQVVGLYVSPVCSCQCENVKLAEVLSPYCSNAGSSVCGTCVCTAGKSGKKCQCEGKEGECRQSPVSSVCSGRGQCECGECKCFEPDIVKGEFCECDITSCPVYNGIMCSGKGECDCGKCVCETGRTGQICECPVGNESCRSRYGAVCSNNGQCQCGSCVCSEGFVGDFCETAESEYELDLSDETTAPADLTFIATTGEQKQMDRGTEVPLPATNYKPADRGQEHPNNHFGGDSSEFDSTQKPNKTADYRANFGLVFLLVLCSSIVVCFGQ